MVGHEIEQQPEPAGVRAREQPIEIGQAAKQRIDARIIRHVIAEIDHRRREDRRDPQRVDAERYEVIEPPLDAVEIADTVTVHVLKGARINLVDYAALPPCGLAHAKRLLGKCVMRQARSASPLATI